MKTLLNLFKKKENGGSLTYIRNGRSFYAEDAVMPDHTGFKDQKEMDDFFKAVCYSRTHI